MLLASKPGAHAISKDRDIIINTPGMALLPRRTAKPSRALARIESALESLMGAPAPAHLTPHLTRLSPSSRDALAGDLACYARFCRKLGESGLPADQQLLTLYITTLSEQGLSPGTCKRRLSSIASIHAALEFAALNAKTLRDTLKNTPAPPLAQPDIPLATLLASCGDDPTGRRDAALLHIAHETGLNASALAALKVSDWSPQRAHLKDVPLSPNAAAALTVWLNISELRSGPLFRRIAVDRRAGRPAQSARDITTLAYHARADLSALRAKPAQAPQVQYSIGAEPLTRQGIGHIFKRRKRLAQHHQAESVL